MFYFSSLELFSQIIPMRGISRYLQNWPPWFSSSLLPGREPDDVLNIDDLDDHDYKIVSTFAVTRHDPQPPWPHEILVPVRWRVSRKYLDLSGWQWLTVICARSDELGHHMLKYLAMLTIDTLPAVFEAQPLCRPPPPYHSQWTSPPPQPPG